MSEGATNGHVVNPRNRYCASLGHHDDDITGLTYMRARWYDASTGRFISEDTARHGGNWFVYGGNLPTNTSDYSGTVWHFVAVFLIGFVAGFMFSVVEQGLTIGWDAINYGSATWEGLVAGAIGTAAAITGSLFVYFGKKLKDITMLAKAAGAFEAMGEGLLAFSTTTKWASMGGKLVGAGIAGAIGAVIKVNLLNLRTQMFLAFLEE